MCGCLMMANERDSRVVVVHGCFPEGSNSPNRFPKTGVLNRVTGTGGARDEVATRGDLLSLGVSRVLRVGVACSASVTV